MPFLFASNRHLSESDLTLILFQATPVSLGTYTKWEDVDASALPAALANVSGPHLLGTCVCDILGMLNTCTPASWCLSGARDAGLQASAFACGVCPGSHALLSLQAATGTPKFILCALLKPL